MTDRTLTGSILGFETFGTAVGLAVVAGALSLIAPPLSVLVGTLAALALAGWASVRYRTGGPRGSVGSKARAGALVAAALAGIVYLDPPQAMEPLRAFLLGLGLVPLWVAERRTPRTLSAEGVER